MWIRRFLITMACHWQPQESAPVGLHGVIPPKEIAPSLYEYHINKDIENKGKKGENSSITMRTRAGSVYHAFCALLLSSFFGKIERVPISMDAPQKQRQGYAKIVWKLKLRAQDGICLEYFPPYREYVFLWSCMHVLFRFCTFPPSNICIVLLRFSLKKGK